MKNTLYILSFFALVLTTSCTKDFEDINTNPNAPNTVQPSLLLRQVIYDFGEQMSYEGFVAGDLLSQHRTALDFNLFDRHDLKSPQLGGNPWPIFYTNLRDNEIILTQSRTTATFRVYEGPALILKAYMAAGLTDLFGDVPYFEAFNGVNGTVTPTYDTQQSIYLDENGILDNLDKGITAIQNYSLAIPLEGDILFDGNLQAWITFANSLKLKYLMRLSDKIDVSEDLQALYNSGDFISATAENAVFNFTNTDPNSFRLAQLRVGDFNNFVLSETMEELLTDLNDNRICTFFRPFENATTNEYNGLLNGIDASSTSIALAEYSLAGTAFREDTSVLDANFMTSWEVYFTLAEAAEKGLITANAQALYNTGVTQAFEYWQTDLPATYLTSNAAYDAVGTTPLQQIMTQKWIATNGINAVESFIDMNRTNFPEVPLAINAQRDKKPTRLLYPSSESIANAANKPAQETDDAFNTYIFWDSTQN